MHSPWHIGVLNGGSYGKESACNMGHLGLILGSGRCPGERNDNPLRYSCLENPMDRGYSPGGCKESAMTERLTISVSLLQS